jgi:rhodanese-related sulfurtransferase
MEGSAVKKLNCKLQTCLLPLITLCLLLFHALPSTAAELKFDTVSSESLKAMLDEKRPMVLVDARTRDEYEEAHIISAINITEKDYDRWVPALPSDRNALLVFYCNGVKCGKSKKVAAKAYETGYRNILVYDEGFPVWDEMMLPIVATPEYREKVAPSRISAADLDKALRAKPEAYLLVDVRDQADYDEGHIPGAVNLSIAKVASQQVSFPKDKQIIVYCNSEGGSYMAYRKMLKATNGAKIRQAALAEWKEAGLPVVKTQIKLE